MYNAFDGEENTTPITDDTQVADTATEEVTEAPAEETPVEETPAV